MSARDDRDEPRGPRWPARRNARASAADILRCFTELVAERGYDEVSVRDVAEALEISKGTILHHFGTKEAMLEQMHNDYMRPPPGRGRTRCRRAIERRPTNCRPSSTS